MKILLVEDNDSDAKLAEQSLQSLSNDLEIKRVETQEEFLKTLGDFNPDVIITDYILPDFDGMIVLKLTQQFNELIPVIILTGSMNEEVAVECMKAGATDYVLKNHYQKLPFAVREALEKIKAIKEKREAQERLRDSEALFRTLTEASLVGIYLVKNYKFTYVNEGFLNIFGYSRDELINKLGPVDLVAEESKEFVRKIIEAKLTSETISTNYVIKARNKAGQHIFIEFFSRAITLKNENYILGAVVDITDRIISEIEVQKSEILFRTVWENSMDAMRLVDENGIVIRVNQAFYDLFEINEKEIIGRPFYIVYDESSRNDNIELFSQRVKSDSIPDKIEMEMLLWNKKKIYMEARNKILIIDGKKYVLTIFRDISERIRYEMELIRAKEEALEMSRLKSNFLANMSHEIRTPLNGMIGFSELLKDSLDGESQQWAEIIYNGSLRLLDTLNTILDFTQIEADKIIPYYVQFDVGEVTRDVVKLFEKAAEKKNLDLIFQCEKENFLVKCDEKLYRRILSNLVNNAIKFTLKGRVIVSVSEENEYFTVKVSDTGIGIPEDKINLIFEEFRQVREGLGRQYEGTGLGLTIVKKYVEKLNGKILVESKVGEGSTFTIYLPKEYNPAK